MNNPKFQVFKGTNNQFYYCLKSSGNGEKIIGKSEVYSSSFAPEVGIFAVKCADTVVLIKDLS